MGFGVPVPVGEQEPGSSTGRELVALLLGPTLIDGGKHNDG